MLILGVETSCDDTAAAVIEARGGLIKPSFTVLSNVAYSQVAIHKKFGGIVPNLASRAHLQKITPTVKAALKTAGLVKTSTSDVGVDLIAVTRGPGLMPSLLVGINFARALAYKWQKLIIGVNHIEGHIYSNWLPPVRESTISDFQFANKNIKFPALVLIVSGGHTELVLINDYGKYKIIGETLDDAAGECFDKTARILGLGYPGGPAIANEAEKITNNKSQITNKFRTLLPRPMINSNDYNFSFSGLKTAVLYSHKGKDKSLMASEIQNAIVDVLVSKTLKAVNKFKPKTVMIAGGVAANKKLREGLALKIAPHKISFLAPELSYATDNAAMIAAAGYFGYLAYRQAGLQKKLNKNSWKKIEPDANLRI